MAKGTKMKENRGDSASAGWVSMSEMTDRELLEWISENVKRGTGITETKRKRRYPGKRALNRKTVCQIRGGSFCGETQHLGKSLLKAERHSLASRTKN